MSEAKAVTYGMLLGAGVMFLMDPRQGGARRARIRDKSLRAIHEVEEAAAIGMRDLSHRSEGVAARARGAGRKRPSSEEVLVNRVRTAIGRVSSHPRAIHVMAKGDGCIELEGPVLSAEVDRVLSTVARIRGVETIDDDLVVNEDAHDVPALQGHYVRRRRRAGVVPAIKLVTAVGAASVGLLSLFIGHPLGLLAGGATVLGLARSVNSHGNRPRRLPKQGPEGGILGEGSQVDALGSASERASWDIATSSPMMP